EKGSLLRRRAQTSNRQSSVDGLLCRLQDRQDSMGARSEEGSAREPSPLEKQLRFGDSRDRWRARLRLLRERGPVLLRNERQVAVVEEVGAVRDPLWLGNRCIAGAV